jgi:hypothetical protein
MKFGAIVKPVVLLPLECVTWYPAHAHKRDRWGEMASFCLLIFEEKIKRENEFPRVIWCMFWVLHSNRTTTVKKTDLTGLKCFQFGPIEVCCLLIVILFGGGIASVAVGENVPKRM